MDSKDYSDLIVNTWLKGAVETKEEKQAREHKEKRARVQFRERVHVLLTDEEKGFCKRKARELRAEGILKVEGRVVKYTDYIEYLVQEAMAKDEEEWS